MSNGQHFFGYGQLEKWLEAIDRSRPVYVIDSEEQAAVNGELGMSYHNLMILCSQPDGEGNVHYCRIIVGRVKRVHGELWSEQSKALVRHAEEASGIVHGWLAERNLTIREAAVDLPTGRQHMDGAAGFLKYSKDAGWRRIHVS